MTPVTSTTYPRASALSAGKEEAPPHLRRTEQSAGEDRLIVFVKAPRRGDVKTRLARALGDAAACEAYCALVGCLLRRLARLSGVELRFTPDDARAEIAGWLAQDWQARPQGPGDLGARLQAAFAEAFAAGARRVAIIGSDCPDVTVDDVREAWQALRKHDAVIGPARDGGYWLIGLRQSCPELFRGIAWSTPHVHAQTLALARARGLRVHQLRELSDVDTAEDWQAFLTRTPNAVREARFLNDGSRAATAGS